MDSVLPRSGRCPLIRALISKPKQEQILGNFGGGQAFNYAMDANAVSGGCLDRGSCKFRKWMPLEWRFPPPPGSALTNTFGRGMLHGMRSLLILLLAIHATRPSLRGGDPATQRGDAAQPNQRLVVLGDSLAAGFGVGAGESWPDRLQSRIQRAGLPFTVVNAGLSGDTTAGGLRRIDWILKQPVDVLVLELGGNDGLRGMAPSATKTNLIGIVQKTRAKWPSASIVLAGMQMPASMGREFSEKFGQLYPEVAKAQRLHLIPHLLEGVGGVPELNLPDLIHPTSVGHDLVASNAWKTIEPVLRQRVGQNSL